MDKNSEFQKEREFIQEYFKAISDKNIKQLQEYLAKIKKSQLDENGKQTSIKELLNTIKEGNGKTAIHFAAARGKLDVFKFLEEQGADLNLRDDRQNSVFIIAAQHSNKEIVTYLLDEKHWDANEQREGITALHLSAQEGNIGMIELLLSHGANLNTLCNHGTPLMFAAAHGQNWCCEHLLKKGADMNMCSNQMPPFLHLVIDQDNKELFNLLFSSYGDKIEIEKRDFQGWSALHLCAEKGRLEMLNTLLGKGADVDYENENQSALDVAVQHQQWECVEKLRRLAQRKEPNVVEQSVELSPHEQLELLEAVKLSKNSGNEHFKQNEFGEAIKYYEEALNKGKAIYKMHGKEIAPICTNIAQCLMRLGGKAKEVIEVCQVARELNKEWMKTYYWEGLAYEELQEYGEAATTYFDALKIHHEPTFKKMFDNAIKKGKEHHKKK